MSLRKFGILCMLRVAGAARADYEEDTLLTNEEGQVSVSKTRLHQLRLLECEDDTMPTEYDHLYCSVFDGNAEACEANGCSMTSSLAPSGKKKCLAECQTLKSDGSASHGTDGLAVPQEVKNAVQKVRELAAAAARQAATKVQDARDAEDAARRQIAHAQQMADEAAQKLKQAEARQKQEETAKDEMEAKIAEAKKSDSELSARAQALQAAQVVRQQALDVMNAKLEAKKEKESQWDMEDMMFKQEMDELNVETIPRLQAQLEAEKRKWEALIASATARRNELGKKRGENNKKRKTEGKVITDEYMQTVNAYKAEKDKVEGLEAAAKSATEANNEITSSAKSAVAAYWEKAEAYKAASEEKSTAKEESHSAQAAAVESEFLYAAKASDMAKALQEMADADSLKMKVQKVGEYSGIFYEKLNKVKQPEGNPMMAVMNLVQDPAMKPCLASYNVVVTAANKITQSNAEEVVSELKTGLTKINSDRGTHFAQWCGTEDFARWIWGANEIERVELDMAL